MNQSFFQKILAVIAGVFHKVETEAEKDAELILTIADNVVNEIKVLEASQVGQFLETTIETIVPASTGLVNGLKLAIPVMANIITAGENELHKTDQQKITDFLTLISKIKTSNPTLYAGILTALNAGVQQFFATNMGVQITPQQSIAAAPVVHDPALGIAA